MYKRVKLDLLQNEKEDVFYKLKNNSIKNIKNIIKWADENGELTEVTMLDTSISFGRIKSDKDFETILALINKSATKYFRIILRKNMNLFGILYNRKVIKDILEIGIRGIDIDSKEYFIFIYMKKEFLEELSGNYNIERI